MPARRWLGSACLLALLWTACGPGARQASPEPSPRFSGSQTLTVGSEQRTYLVHLPPGFSASRRTALVLVLHPYGSSGQQMEGAFGIESQMDARGYIAVYPDGLNGAWNVGFCCAGAKADDVGFIGALLDRLEQELPVDPRSVFVTGISNGALLAYLLGCEMGGRIAAIAPVAGTLGSYPECRPSRPVSLLHIHGTADATVKLEGGSDTYPGASFPPVLEGVQRWAGFDGCGPGPVSATGPAGVTTRRWKGCAEGASVTLITVEGLPHTWPVTGFVVNGNVQPGLDASKAIGEFFAKSGRPS